MPKKPVTKSQIVSHFAKKFELSRKTAFGIVEEIAALALSATKKTGSFTLPGIGKLVLVKRKARMGFGQKNLTENPKEEKRSEKPCYRGSDFPISRN